MELTNEHIFSGVILFMVAEFTWEFYLAIRQHKIYRKHTKIPNELIGILSQDTFDKARLYAIDKSKFSMVNDALSLAFAIAFLFCDGLLLSWNYGGNICKSMGFKENEIIQTAVTVFVLNILTFVVGLPSNIYYTFVVEQKHGFNKQTPSFYACDKLKMLVLNQVIVVPLMCGIIYIVKIGGDYFFVYLWVFVMAITLFLYTIYPDYIAPLFDKYTVLPKGELREEIEKLASSVDFPLYKLYVVEGSKRSAHSNAYFYGFFKNKRIVLFDTLLKDYEPENSKKDTKKEEETKLDKQEKKGCDTMEVLAVLGHELGHWKYNHVLKNLVIMQANLFLLFLVFGKLFHYKALYAAFGFYDSTPILIGFIIVFHFICLPYFELVNFCIAILSRRFEFQADQFAKSLGRVNHLKLALIKLNSDNLGFPIYDPWYSKWHHSHPPLLERLQALDKND
ncbi:hypothetical protein RUM44_012644 [Polyplax serrata]|uniref:CAAX prenyl protease n=1 Tax=Polyplax serrata TaxID=468196 RepID=A0ABR1BBX7_POLSC